MNDDIQALLDNRFERLSRELLDALEAKYAPHEKRTARTPSGEVSVALTPDEAAIWDMHPDACAAERFGLSLDQYDAWIALDSDADAHWLGVRHYYRDLSSH